MRQQFDDVYKKEYRVGSIQHLQALEKHVKFNLYRDPLTQKRVFNISYHQNLPPFNFLYVKEEMDDARRNGTEVEANVYIRNEGRWTLGRFQVECAPWIETKIHPEWIKKNKVGVLTFIFDPAEHYNKTLNHLVTFIIEAGYPEFVFDPELEVVRELREGVRKWEDLSEDEKKIVELQREEDRLRFESFLEWR